MLSTLQNPCQSSQLKETGPVTTVNPEMITSVGTTFVTTIEHNVARMSKQIVDLQNRLYAPEQKAARAEQEKKGRGRKFNSLLSTFQYNRATGCNKI